MGLVAFVRTRVWGELPHHAPFRSRAIAAASWCGGLLILAIFFGTRRYLAQQPVGDLPWILATVGLALAILIPLPVVGEWLYLFVLRIFAVVGFFMGNLLLIVLFYLFVTPMAWILRLAGKDFLDIRNRKPHWIPHTRKMDRKRFYRLS